MEILIVTLFVCMVLIISYVSFDQKIKKQKREIDKKNVVIQNFYKQEINRIGKLRLEGTGNDGNSDFEFKQAVKKINLPNDIRVQLYD